MNRITLCIVPFAFLVGCSSGPAITATKTAFVLPPGAVRADSGDKTVSIGVPTGWRVGVANSMMAPDLMAGMGGGSGGDGADGGAAKAMEDMARSSAASAKEQEEAALEKLKEKGIIINCVNSSKPIPGEQPTRFYVKKESQGGNWTMEDAEKSEYGQFKNKPTATKVTLPVGTALRMEDTWQLVDGANFTQVSYVIVNGKDLYRIRFITEESKEVVTGIDKQVAESFRIN